MPCLAGCSNRCRCHMIHKRSLRPANQDLLDTFCTGLNSCVVPSSLDTQLLKILTSQDCSRYFSQMETICSAIHGGLILTATMRNQALFCGHEAYATGGNVRTLQEHQASHNFQRVKCTCITEILLPCSQFATHTQTVQHHAP